ncbi:DUF6146 family protein [Marinilabilia rubra]|uniref:Lipoprotein n=1 Tax=Marinilabilia rubra TaxID=2162893 RepID=A0A2U2BDV3_9BACT|nr:DUF6146 family protein [Marinilabilia rubra]PWE01213.1 hypothetical protein DDZ16_01625 [Marinilabilia rubra]
MNMHNNKEAAIKITFKAIPLLLLVFGISFQSCKTLKKGSAPEQKVDLVENDTTNMKDSTEYELVVLDPGFESYLATQPPPNYHSQQYYETWNQQYVVEWNYRHDQPLTYGDFYETRIHYNTHENYGLELNYRLYYYFQFIKDEYGIVLVDRGR